MRSRERQYIRRMPRIYGNLQRQPRSWRWLKNLVRILIGIVSLTAVIYAVWYSGWFNLHQVEVEGTHFSSAEAIRSLMPMNRNLFLIAPDSLRREILRDPTIQSVAIFKGLPDSLKVVIQEKQPSLIWISGPTDTVIDQQGFAYLQFSQATFPAPTTPLGQYLATVPRLIDRKSLSVQPGAPVVTANFIHFITDVQQNLHDLLPKVSIDHWEITDSTYDVTMVAKSGLQVQFTSLGEAAPAVRNLQRLLDQKKATLTSSVDLRIDRWAFVQ